MFDYVLVESRELSEPSGASPGLAAGSHHLKINRAIATRYGKLA